MYYINCHNKYDLLFIQNNTIKIYYWKTDIKSLLKDLWHQNLVKDVVFHIK